VKNWFADQNTDTTDPRADIATSAAYVASREPRTRSPRGALDARGRSMDFRSRWSAAPGPVDAPERPRRDPPDEADPRRLHLS